MIPSLLLFLALPQAASKQVDLLEIDQVRIGEYHKIQAIRDKLRTLDPKVGPFPPGIMADPELVGLGLGSNQEDVQVVQDALAYRFDSPSLTGFHKLDFAANDPVLAFTTARIDASGEPTFQTVKAAFEKSALSIFKIRLTQTPGPTVAGQPAAAPTTRDTFIGPITHDDLVNELKFQETRPSGPVKVKAEELPGNEIPVDLFDDSRGEVVVGLKKAPPYPLAFPVEPQMPLFGNTPDEVQKAYKREAGAKSPNLIPASIAVEDGKRLVPMEHLRRAALTDLQNLCQTVRKAHPTRADFPPELLQTPEFKNTGLEMPRDQGILHAALTYKPEGTPLKGFHPVDFSKDPIGGYATVSLASVTTPEFIPIRQAYEGKDIFLMRLRVSPSNPKPTDKPVDVYVGPLTHDDLETLKKRSGNNANFEELKGESLPLKMYADEEGNVAFVFESKPDKPLRIPTQPRMPIFKESADQLKKLSADKKPLPKPMDNVVYAIKAGR